MATFSNRQMSVPVPVEFINKYMINANATYVKVYLYGLAKCCEPEADVTNASIAEALDILETDVTKAERTGLYSSLLLPMPQTCRKRKHPMKLPLPHLRRKSRSISAQP